ncbi:fumarylacetoacetate hydrolase family protein [Streptomyces sp. NPDC052023]|uniref:fumarylacetoacetate hydrolase family protein n=1 Tax=Streptomyces sp. NPDC052023 TaxID=3365681 RepID=UPI0037D0EF50
MYSTDQGIAREDEPGELAFLDLPFPDLGELLRSEGDLESVRTAPATGRKALADVAVRAPVARPGKVIVVGLNFASHADETREALKAMGRELKLPTTAPFHLAAGSSVIGPGQPIVLPAAAPEQVDYEGEVAAVIGTRATDVAPANAWRHLAGLTVVNDVSARDIQMRSMGGADPAASVGLSKSLDTFKPLGPCLVTADEFSEPLDLGIRTRVNGDLRQDDRTTGFLHPVSELVSRVSHWMTLEPGDVLCLGSPRGAGAFSGQFLAPGDTVEITVERIGSLRNTVQG